MLPCEKVFEFNYENRQQKYNIEPVCHFDFHFAHNCAQFLQFLLLQTSEIEHSNETKAGCQNSWVPISRLRLGAMKSCETPPLSQRYYQIRISAKLIGPSDSCKISGFGFQKKISDYVLAEGSKSRKKAFAFSIAGNSFDHDSTVQICVIFIRFAFDMLSPHMIPASRFLIIVGCRTII